MRDIYCLTQQMKKVEALKQVQNDEPCTIQYGKLRAQDERKKEKKGMKILIFSYCYYSLSLSFFLFHFFPPKYSGERSAI